MAPTVADAATIKDQTNKEIDDVLQLVSEFNKVDAAATRRKKVDYCDKLFDNIQDEPGRREEVDDLIKTEDIFINDNIFSDTDPKDISNLIDEIKSGIDVIDILFEHVPINTASNVPLLPEPKVDFSNILLRNNKEKQGIKKIREKYLKMGQNRDKVRRSAQRAIRQLKKLNYLETDNTKTVNYNNDVDIDNISADVNNDLNLLSDAETIIYEGPIIKLRNPKRKSALLQCFISMQKKLWKMLMIVTMFSL